VKWFWIAPVFAVEPKSYFTRLFSPENLPNIVLSIAGIAGIIVAIYTLKKIGKQTTAIENSVKLQEAQMRQWVVILNWQFDGQEFTKNTIAGGPLKITFDVFNPTEFPLTFENWSVRIATKPYAETVGTLLPPDSPYLATVSIGTDGDVGERFLRNELVLPIVGEIAFTDVLGDRQRQSFSQMCVCGQGVRAKFYRHEGVAEKLEPEKPN
jgi:hypothetical protein